MRREKQGAVCIDKQIPDDFSPCKTNKQTKIKNDSFFKKIICSIPSLLNKLSICLLVKALLCVKTMHRFYTTA